MSRRGRALLACAGLLAGAWLIVAAGGARAGHGGSTDHSWTGLGNSTSWTEPSNWEEEDAPASNQGDSATFPDDLVSELAGLRTVNHNVTGGGTYSELTFEGDDYAISGQRFTLDKITNNASGTTISAPITVSAGETLEVTGTGSLELSGAVSGSGTLKKTGPGTLNLSADNSEFTGAVIIEGGTIQVDHANALGGASPVTVKPAQPGQSATLNMQAHPLATPLSLEGGTLQTTGPLTGTIALTEAGGTINVPNGTATRQAPITGSGGLTKSGTGDLVLEGAQSFSGGVTVNAGVLRAAGAAALGTGSAPVVVNAALELPDGTTLARPVHVTGNGGNGTQGPIRLVPPPENGSAAGGITVTGAVTLTGPTTFAPAQDVTVALVGGIGTDDPDQNRNLIHNGAGTLVLGGDRSYGGDTTVGQGSVLRIESGESLDEQVGKIEVNGGSGANPGGRLEITGGAAVSDAVVLNRTGTSTASLVGGGGATIRGNVTVNGQGGTTDADAIPVNVPGGRLTIAGRIGPEEPPTADANRGIEKLGGGTLALDGDSPVYHRTVTARAGILLANGELPNVPVVVPGDGSGTVGGSGTVKSLTFETGAGGGVRPGGTNPGTLTVLENATLTNTTSLTVDLAGAGATASAAQTNGEGEGDPPAAKHDVLKVNGTLTLGAARLVPRFSYTPSEGDTFVVAEAGTLSGTFGGLGEGSQLLANNHTLSVSYAGNKVTLTVLEVGEPSDDTVGKVTRLWGADRVETGIVVSDHAFPAAKSAEAVVLARADLYPDALAGTPLAVKKGGPLLVTGRSALDPRVADELERVLDLGKTVYLLGGPAALAPEVEQAVADAGYVVVRLAGETRYETAIAIATDGLGDPSTILLATGVNFPDALAGAAAGSVIDGAVLLSAGEDSHPATTAYLAERSGVTVYALGGPAARAYPSAIAVVGEDRYETATKTASELFDLELADVVGIATGTNFPDALTGGAHVGHPDRAGPLVLTHPQGVPPPTSTWLAQHGTAMTRAFVYGGPVAVSAAVVNDIAALLDGDL